MKSFLFFPVLFLISSCGVTEQLSKNCGSSIEMGCNLVFGTKDADQDEQIAKNTAKNSEQDEKISQIQNQNEQLIQSMDSFSLQIEQSQTEDVNYLSQLINALQNTVNANIVSINNLQSSLNGSAIKIIDVCGDYPGYFDEVILKTNTGKYIAYFEDGGRRFLSELPVGTYQTTDKQQCSFTVSAAGLVHTVGATVKTE
jgi:hypothetical protein